MPHNLPIALCHKATPSQLSKKGALEQRIFEAASQTATYASSPSGETLRHHPLSPRPQHPPHPSHSRTGRPCTLQSCQPRSSRFLLGVVEFPVCREKQRINGPRKEQEAQNANCEMCVERMQLTNAAHSNPAISADTCAVTC